MYEINKEEDDLSLLNLVIIFMFLSSVVLYILYITKTHEKSYLVAKKITKQINLEIKTKGSDHIFYCFTHSNSSSDTNIECKEKDSYNENPFDYYNTLVMYFSNLGDFDQNKVLSVYNYSESYIILMDNDNNNFNNALGMKNQIYVVPSAIYTNSNKYLIQIINSDADYEKYSDKNK